MDPLDAFPSAPVRYTFDDDESDDEYTQASQVGVKLSVHLSSGQSAPTLILGLSGPGSVFTRSLGPDIQAVGHLSYQIQEDKEEKWPIYCRDTLLFIPIDKALPREDITEAARSVLAPFSDIQKVIVLDSFTSTMYTSSTWNEDMYPPCLRLLQTTNTSKIPDIQQYEPPNILQDMSAALMTYCEVRNIPCYTLLSLQESLLGKLIVTGDTLNAYVQGLQSLGLKVEYDESRMNEILQVNHSGRVDEHHHRLFL
ncbi:uncharacterized protein BYT42DRAFT_549190 [Radiomyces spectabilis]|uniref:uncharacterized protein n=1 Tax=Radiomyces spectabilis TaxID=64574 RepID=UPI00221F37B4|nr:uncharacterized protein BYT42DRAFT_549190 [Radiomyces spectabilis]KAI8369519.1 hypothetical protein BYT42DRAFT_549190 [Radiomyces spectabilis]